MWSDAEFGFRADDKMIVKIVSSLSFEYTCCKYSKDADPVGILQIGIISDSLWFIYEGSVEINYRDGQKIVVLEPGSYFGEVSLILQIKNQYHYRVAQA